MVETELTRKILKSKYAKEMYRKVSPVYGESYVYLWLLQVIGVQFDDINQWIEEFKLQTVPNTATWFLPDWEKEYKITPKPGETIEQRRQNVINKMWSNSPMNPAKVEIILSSIAGAEVEIQENTGKNKFSVFISTKPYLCDETAVRTKLNEIKQAHLIYDITYQNTIDTDIYIAGCVQVFKEITLREG